MGKLPVRKTGPPKPGGKGEGGPPKPRKMGHVPEPVVQRLREATWSVYYHSMYLQGLGESALSRIDAPGVEPHAPMDLRHALKEVQKATDPHRDMRRQRVLRKLAAAGFANTKRREQLIEAFTGMQQNAAVVKVKEVAKGVDLLIRSVGLDVALLNSTSPEEAVNVIDEMLAKLLPGCVTANATCQACYVPFDPVRPTTAMTARVHVKRPAADMAKVIDPRAWATCSDIFTRSDPVEYDPSTGKYNSKKIPSQLGTPWNGLLDEEVEVGTAKFGNVLLIDFNKTGVGEWTVKYGLWESRKLEMPLVNLNECVNMNEGVVVARTLVPGWTELVVEKKVQFVDLTIGTKPNPFGVDPGEIMNVWAPVILCLWLEDYTQLGPCCMP